MKRSWFFIAVLIAIGAGRYYWIQNSDSRWRKRIEWVVLTRLDVPEGASVRKVVATMYVAGNKVEFPVLQAGFALISPDGEPLITDPDELSSPVPDGLWAAEVDAWDIGGMVQEDDPGYIEVSEGARRFYWQILTGGGSDGSDDHLEEVCRVECDRLVRDAWRPWVSWGFIAHQARELKALATHFGIDGLDERMDSLLATDRQIAEWRARDAAGMLTRVEQVCLAELHAGDGKFRRRIFPAVAGFYSGGWGFRQLYQEEKAMLASYWSSNLLTRYVERTFDGQWKLLTLGERIREFARVEVGRECSLDEFLDAIRR